MINEPITVTDADFDKSVLKNELPVIVDFWAPWCGPCRAVAPVLKQFAKDYAGKLVVAKVNTDEDNQHAMQYDVRGIPTMLFVANGKVLHRQVGVPRNPMDLKGLVDAFLEVVEQSKEEPETV